MHIHTSYHIGDINEIVIKKNTAQKIVKEKRTKDSKLNTMWNVTWIVLKWFLIVHVRHDSKKWEKSKKIYKFFFDKIPPELRYDIKKHTHTALEQIW